MRFLGSLLLIVLIAAAVVMYLNARTARESMEAVHDIALTLREEGVSGLALDPRTAALTVTALEELLAQPDRIPDRSAELAAVAAVAAAWASGAEVPSGELRFAVAVRSAADELRAYALRPSRLRLGAARGHLDRARAVLEGAGGGGAVGGLRDQLENLDRARQEQHQRLEEELAR